MDISSLISLLHILIYYFKHKFKSIKITSHILLFNSYEFISKYIKINIQNEKEGFDSVGLWRMQTTTSLELPKYIGRKGIREISGKVRIHKY